MRVVEGSAFVAAPLGGAVMASMGADVIRFDPIGGGIDFERWPVTATGTSLYWAGLNQGKRSVTINTRTDEGRDLACSIAAAPGPSGGIALTNHPAGSWFSYERLRARRHDVIVCSIQGHADGRSAVDYTINASVGLPSITGDEGEVGVVNSPLPVWDVVTGNMAVIALLAGERRRRMNHAGSHIQIALADVARSVVAHLGYVAEAALGTARPRSGNFVFGAFGRDFETSDGRRVMIVAITAGQLGRLAEALGIQAEISDLESETRRIRSHGELFEARRDLASVVGSRVHSLSYEDLTAALDDHAVLWGPYQDFKELSTPGPWSVFESGFLSMNDPDIGSIPIGPSPIRFDGSRLQPVGTPRLGEHTDDVLEEILHLSPMQIGQLHDRGVVAGGR